MDIQSTVTGLPRIRKVLVRERSTLVNQWLRQYQHRRQHDALGHAQQEAVHVEQIQMLVMTPVSAASTPQSNRLQNISRLALRVSAYQAAGIWNRK